MQVPLTALLLIHLASVTLAQPQLLVDINRQVQGPSSSTPARFAASGAHVYFAAKTPATGVEPWVVDAIGMMSSLGDLWPGPQSSDPREFTAFADGVVFSARDPMAGTELWFAAPFQPPHRIADIVPGVASSYPSGFVRVGARVFFVAGDRVHGHELWSTDGTTAGTRFVFDLRPGSASANIRDLAPFGTRVAFIADDGQHGYELWVSDGTATGTYMVVDLNLGVAWGLGPIAPLALGSRLLFAGDDGRRGVELWSTDGTAAGTSLVTDIVVGPGHSLPNGFVRVRDGQALFAAGDIGGARTLWTTDGTSSGTRMMAIPGLTAPDLLAADGTGRAFFVAQTQQVGREAWVTDGTPQGTSAIDLFPGPVSTSPHVLEAAGGRAFFVTGTQVYRSDGTLASTVALTPPDGFARHTTNDGLIVLTNALAYFSGNSASAGVELWRSDGSQSGTTLHFDLDPNQVTADANPFYCGSVGGRALWDVTTGGNAPHTMVAIDGTAGGVVPLVEARAVWTIHKNDVGGFVLLMTWTDSQAFVVSDGTAAGTRPLTRVVPSIGTSPDDSAAIDGGRVVFSAAPPGTSDFELWITDGTDQGTNLVRDINPRYASSPRRCVRVGRNVFFVADDGVGGDELWRTDGTQTGTTLVGDIRPGTRGSDFQKLAVIGERLIFTANDGVAGQELWRADAAGATLVADLTVGPGSTTFGSAATADGRAVFAARLVTTSSVYGTDGSSVALLPIRSSVFNQAAYSVVTLGRRVLVVVNNGLHRVAELFLTDGTVAGTSVLAAPLPIGTVVSLTSIGTTHAAFLVKPLAEDAHLFLVEDATSRVVALGRVPLPLSSDPVLTLVNGALVFAALDEIHGRELWHVSLAASAQPEGLGCGTGRVDLRASAPRVGGNVTFSIAGAAPAAILALGFPPAAPLPVPALGVGCTLFVDVSRPLFWLPFVQGASDLTIPIPASFRLLRMRLSGQVVTGPTLAGIDLSSAVRLTLDT